MFIIKQVPKSLENTDVTSFGRSFNCTSSWYIDAVPSDPHLNAAIGWGTSSVEGLRLECKACSEMAEMVEIGVSET